MFDTLSKKLQSTMERFSKRKTIDEKTLEKGLRDIKLSLLEADVNYKVVSDFVNHIRQKALGAQVTKGVTPSQQLVKLVYDEFKDMLGSEESGLKLLSKPSIILLIGLQGSGKTTTAAKLASYLKKNGKKVLLTSVDIHRPAAMLQLEKLGNRLSIPVFIEKGSAVGISKHALEKAKGERYDVLIVDTAGRIHVDKEMMEEAKAVKDSLNPDETLFAVDAMAGQEAVNVAKAFDEQVGMTGIVLTKVDSDTRGGVAFSVKGVTGKPIKFVGTGENIGDFDVFHPDRIASRILGMGDVVSLVEKAQEVIDEDEAASMQQKLLSGSFTLEDFRQQLRTIQKLGPLKKVMGMIPGLGNRKLLKQLESKVDESKLKRVEAVINSMTKEERTDHAIINSSRKRRIAKGSGTSIRDVNNLIKQFVQAKMAMKQMKKHMKKGKLPFSFM